MENKKEIKKGFYVILFVLALAIGFICITAKYVDVDFGKKNAIPNDTIIQVDSIKVAEVDSVKTDSVKVK